MSERTYDNLDFDGVLDSIIYYMQNEDSPFKDYNFDGSALRELARVLAYNSTNKSYESNIGFNELHLDTAQQYNNVFSVSNLLSYTPRSRVSSKMTVNVTITANMPTNPSQLVLPKETVFESSNDGLIDTTRMFFSPDRDYVANLSGGSYVFNNVRLVEGTWVTQRYVHDGGTTPLIRIQNENIDTSSLLVNVITSNTDDTVIKFNQFVDAHQLDPVDPIYYLSSSPSGGYQIEFGDNVLSKRLDTDNIVMIEYVTTKGSEGNGYRNFSAATAVGSYTAISVSNVSEFSSGGDNRESVFSVRKLAPASFGAQLRAVTPEDYKALVMNLFQRTKDVNTWDNVATGQAGFINVAIATTDGSPLTDLEKTTLESDIQKFNVGSFTPIFHDATQLLVNIRTTVRYSLSETNKNTAVLQSIINNGLISYSANTYERFSENYFHQPLTAHINTLDTSFVNNTTVATYEKHIDVILNRDNNIEYSFNKRIKNVVIDEFTISDTTDSTYEIRDLNSDLILYRDGNVVSNIGNVVYSTGTIKFNIRPDATTNGYFNIKCESDEDNYDITVKNNEVIKINNIDITLAGE